MLRLYRLYIVLFKTEVSHVYLNRLRKCPEECGIALKTCNARMNSPLMPLYGHRPLAILWSLANTSERDLRFSNIQNVIMYIHSKTSFGRNLSWEKNNWSKRNAFKWPGTKGKFSFYFRVGQKHFLILVVFSEAFTKCIYLHLLFYSFDYYFT